MAKTKEELTQLKTECEALTNKLKELTEDELKQVSGGTIPFALITEIAIGGIQPFVGSAFSQTADKAADEKRLTDNMAKAA